MAGARVVHRVGALGGDGVEALNHFHRQRRIEFLEHAAQGGAHGAGADQQHVDRFFGRGRGAVSHAARIRHDIKSNSDLRIRNSVMNTEGWLLRGHQGGKRRIIRKQQSLQRKKRPDRRILSMMKQACRRRAAVCGSDRVALVRTGKTRRRCCPGPRAGPKSQQKDGDVHSKYQERRFYHRYLPSPGRPDRG